MMKETDDVDGGGHGTSGAEGVCDSGWARRSAALMCARVGSVKVGVEAEADDVGAYSEGVAGPRG